jgi:hypothetical protein
MRKRAKFAQLAPVGVALAVAILALVTDAWASATYDSLYGYDRTWNASLRLVRVDLALKVTEKDDRNGYILFEYRSAESGSKVTSGSMEIVRPKDDEAPVKVMVQLPQMPRYHEQVILDQLARKMREEYGDPPPHVHHEHPAPKEHDAHDGGAGDGDGDEEPDGGY